jgi:DNA-binding NarL/FixJ family response regulator
LRAPTRPGARAWRKTDIEVTVRPLLTPPDFGDDLHMPRTVLIVDDNPRFRIRARRWLEAEGYTVVGEAADGASALDESSVHRPQVVLLDVQLPDMSGLVVAERLAREPEPPAVVLTSTHDLNEFGDAVQRCGARGFVPKAELTGTTLAEVLG